jgi:capsule polysaccharide modification protein KpsS
VEAVTLEEAAEALRVARRVHQMALDEGDRLFKASLKATAAARGSRDAETAAEKLVKQAELDLYAAAMVQP